MSVLRYEPMINRKRYVEAYRFTVICDIQGCKEEICIRGQEPSVAIKKIRDANWLYTSDEPHLCPNHNPTPVIEGKLEKEVQDYFKAVKTNSDAAAMANWGCSLVTALHDELGRVRAENEALKTKYAELWGEVNQY